MITVSENVNAILENVNPILENERYFWKMIKRFWKMIKRFWNMINVILAFFVSLSQLDVLTKVQNNSSGK